jgi:ABC-2 type transport system ATP-binding protein
MRRSCGHGTLDSLDGPMNGGTTTATETVRVDRIRKSYGPVLAVDELSFSGQAGEVLGLLGPNGAGKTTAIRVLTTILSPDQGGFAIAGTPHTQPTRIRERIGVLPESAGYPDQQTGLEFLTYYGELFGHPRGEARGRATRLLAEIGLADRASSRIGTYSRGMRQRLGIVRALINDPAVVFFDEPTLGLDPAGQRQVLRLIADTARERGTTVILTTHLLSEVEETCTRVLILNRGKVISEGTVGEVTRRASAPRRARFRIPPEQRDRAIEAIRRQTGIGQAAPVGDRSDALAVTLDRGGAELTETSAELARLVDALADAGVPILAFELEGARLSDVFLAMTGEET